MTIELFGSVDGTEVFEITLRNPSGAAARILTWGAVVRDLTVPTRQGPQPVVLGLDTVEDYIAHSPYFGAVVGRYANRIGGARFSIDGETYEIDANEGRNQLHGGTRGFGSRVWSVIDRTQASVTLALVSEDGDMGYPGRLTATCTYTLLEPATLRFVLEATTDRATPVNLTNHCYFNLDGSSDISSHHLMIAADHVTPTAPDLIPTGEIKSVAGTAYDFRSLRPIGASALMQGRVSYDINYVLRGGEDELAHAVTLKSLNNNLSLELWTTEPGVQFYDGHLIDIPVPGLRGTVYGRHAGLCLEPQRFPDSPNKAHFSPCILEPEAVSRQISELRFAVE
jgi:aldose 1-epimerase